MTKDEKKNVFIAVALSVAAVIIIFLWGKHGTTLVANQANQPDTSGAVTVPAPNPTYVNYNIPAFNQLPPQVIGPTSLPPITTNGSNGSCGCSNPCGGSGSIQNQSVLNFNQLV